MREWKNLQLGSCVQLLSGGTPSKANDDYWNGDIPWISAKDLKSFFLNDSQDHITAKAVLDGAKVAPKNSILILVRGMTLHNDVPIGCPTREMAFNQDIKAIIADQELINTKYLSYWLLAHKRQLMGLVESASHGTGRINTNELKSLMISCPVLSEQKRISDLFDNFDRKIENLRKQNETLEKIAQTLFKHWFVDFEFPFDFAQGKPSTNGKPYKSSGGAMVPSELGGEIPAGWRVGKLGNEFNVSIGRTPPRKESEWFSTDAKHVKWISIKDMGSCGAYIFETSEYLTREAIAQFNIPVIPSNTVILSFKLTVGRVAITSEAMLSNEAIAHLKTTAVSPSSGYIYLFLSQFNFDKLGSTSSIAKAVNSKSIKALEFLIPTSEILRRFSQTIKPLFDKLKINLQQIQTLTKTRDALLPKLMSGKLRVGDDQHE